MVVNQSTSLLQHSIGRGEKGTGRRVCVFIFAVYYVHLCVVYQQNGTVCKAVFYFTLAPYMKEKSIDDKIKKL